MHSSSSLLHARAVNTKLWGYEPNLAANIIFVVLFVALTSTHFWMRWRLGSVSKFFNPLLAGGIFEIVGYAARAAATSAGDSVATYALQSLFLLLAPVLFSATCYMTLARIVQATDSASYLRIPLPWLTKTFVIADIVTFIIQAGGGGLQTITGDATSPLIGKWLVVAGLILQVITFSIYLILAIDVDYKLHKLPTSRARSMSHIWKRLFIVIYVVSGLIILRNVVRVVEYAQGREGWINQHEVMLFVFDAVPMTLLMLVLAIFHPANLLAKQGTSWNTENVKLEGV